MDFFMLSVSILGYLDGYGFITLKLNIITTKQLKQLDSFWKCHEHDD